jgi:hypothetical protein
MLTFNIFTRTYAFIKRQNTNKKKFIKLYKKTIKLLKIVLAILLIIFKHFY